MRLSGWVTLASCALVCAACESEDPCTDLSPCDVRSANCQRSIIEAVACHRSGSVPASLVVRLVSEDEFLERATGELDEDELATEVLWNRGLALYELAPVDFDPEAESRDIVAETAAVYLPEDKEILLVDRGEPLDGTGAVEILAHEIVHAMQDAEHDLLRFGERWATSFDAALALHGLIEGEATHYQGIVAAQLQGYSFERIDWPRVYDEMKREMLVQAEADEAPVAMAPLRFPYAFGGAFVNRHYTAGAQAAIDELFEAPPRASWQILFGPDDGVLERESERLDPRAVPALPEPFEETISTPLGAWVQRIFAARRGAPLRARWDLAEQTAADRFAVQVDREVDTVVASWRMRMQEGSEPSIWPNVDLGPLHRELDRGERELAIVAAEPELPLPLEELSWRAPDPEGDGASAGASSSALPSTWDSILRCAHVTLSERLP